MKGTVQRRWKMLDKGEGGCKHEWHDPGKDSQRCQRCGARRVRSARWTWQHEVHRNGKRAYVTGTARLKESAQKALTESLALHAKGEQVEPSKVTVAAFLRDWLELVGPRLKPGTARSYHDMVEHRASPTLATSASPG
jgi:hypothetical protein